MEEEGVAGAAGEGGEGGAEGVVVADEQIAVLWDVRVEPAAVLEEEVAGSAAGGRRGQVSSCLWGACCSWRREGMERNAQCCECGAIGSR